MQVHQLTISKFRKTKKRIGRGGKRGTYSGRGQKGQKARAGAKIKPEVRELILKFPKKRGLGFHSKKTTETVVVKLKEIKKVFPKSEVITPTQLAQKGLIPQGARRRLKVKIVEPVTLGAAYTIKKCGVSQGVKEAVIKAGGQILEN